MYPISFIYVWTTFKHQVQGLHASKKMKIFLVLAGQKYISGTNRATNEQLKI